jgi:glycerol-3-phosphate acyltransferase PlsY
LATATALAAFAITLAATRYVAVASITGTCVLALVAPLSGSPASVALAAAGLAALIVWKHRGNLMRLARGNERRLGS